jgi:hypothetical protein
MRRWSIEQLTLKRRKLASENQSPQQRSAAEDAKYFKKLGESEGDH